ncbi:MAG: YbaN family protein [Acidobacteria bacterium]|nr:YbaN family protein [Acidobacteriota bacterium]
MIRILYIFMGTVSVGLGIAGILLPLLPATPFMLLAAWCYTRSSPRLRRWLVNHPVLGAPIRDFRDNRPLPRGRLISILAILWTSIGVSVLIVDPLLIKLLLPAIAASVTAWLLVRQTRLARTPSPPGRLAN